MSEQRSYPTNNPQSFPSAGTPPNPDAVAQANEQYAEYHEQRRTAAFENKVQVRFVQRVAASIAGAQNVGDVAWVNPQQAQALIDSGVCEYAGEGEPPASGQARTSDTVHANKAYEPKEPSPVQRAAAARPTPSSEAKDGPSTASASSKESGKDKP